MPLTATSQEVSRLSDDRIKAYFPRGDCGYKLSVHSYKINGNLISKIYSCIKKKKNKPPLFPWLTVICFVDVHTSLSVPFFSRAFLNSYCGEWDHPIYYFQVCKESRLHFYSTVKVNCKVGI